MSTQEIHLADCPNCGASLELKRVRKGTVDCLYCGKTIALKSLPTLAADPAAVEALDRQAASPTLAAAFFGTLGKYFELPARTSRRWRG